MSDFCSTDWYVTSFLLTALLRCWIDRALKTLGWAVDARFEPLMLAGCSTSANGSKVWIVAVVLTEWPHVARRCHLRVARGVAKLH